MESDQPPTNPTAGAEDNLILDNAEIDINGGRSGNHHYRCCYRLLNCKLLFDAVTTGWKKSSILYWCKSSILLWSFDFFVSFFIGAFTCVALENPDMLTSSTRREAMIECMTIDWRSTCLVTRGKLPDGMSSIDLRIHGDESSDVGELLSQRLVLVVRSLATPSAILSASRAVRSGSGSHGWRHRRLKD